MTEPEFNELLSRYLAGEASAAEQKLLDRFFQSYQKEASSDPEWIDARTRSEIFRKVSARVEGREMAVNVPLIFKIAASLAIIFLTAYFLFPRKAAPTAVAMVTETAARGEKLALTLPDSSRVMLNAGSSLTYPRQFRKSRAVKLHGEGYFDVVTDTQKPFVIQVQNTSVTVLGTSFNVNAFSEKSTIVTLVEGRVKVNASRGDSTLLSPGEQAVIDSHSGSIRTSMVNVERFASWKNNLIWFEETPLSEAADVLENWYGVTINIENVSLATCTITAKYGDEKLENILKSLQFLLKVDYAINADGTITISGKGCK